jgi:hypothetical protein
VRLVLAAAVLTLAACSAPDKLILPGKVDLPLVAGDRIKLCTDDGVDDTTPMSDCVIVEGTTNPIEPYADLLKAKGWTREGIDPAEREVWTFMGATSCQRLVIDGEREKMSRKRFSILRFEFSEGSCAA